MGKGRGRKSPSFLLVKKMGETDDNNKWIQNWTLYYWEREGGLWLFRSKTIYITDIIETRYKLMKRRNKKE